MTEDEEDRTPSLKRFGFVQTLDTKSKRRLYEVLQSQDLQMNQEITFLSDGDDTLRQLQLEMSPKATHILDWFHLTMKLTVLGQYGKGLVQCEAVLGEQIQDQIERLKWSLWHGQVDKALGKIDDLEGSVAKFDFWGKIQKSGIRNSTTLHSPFAPADANCLNFKLQVESRPQSQPL